MLRTTAIFVAVLGSVLGPATGAAGGQTPSTPAPGALAELSAAAGGDVRATVSRRSGVVSFLSTTPGAPIPTRGSDAEERARRFLGEQMGLFGVRSADNLVTLRVGPVDDVGMEHVRFQQTHRGIPVTGGEIGVHLRDRGVVAVHAKTLPNLDAVPTVPTLSAADARERALASLTRTTDLEGVTLSEPRLEIFDRGHLGGPPFPTRLAWFVEARRVDLREYVWIDAENGLVLLSFSQLTDARDRKIYDADDPGDGVYDDLPGTLIRSEGDPATGDGDANAAYDYSGDTYDYFSTEHGRDSYDGAGATLVSTVHFCQTAGDCPFANAFWNGSQMVYGEGFSTADDVDAHELTHAVTEHTADLFYYMQSGALNESYSDIFGETVDLTNGAGTDTLVVRWLLGEDVPGVGAIRDLLWPTAFDDPGKLSDSQFVCADPGGDRGGVHSNSGVPNHAYALMVDGGSYNGVTVSGIGLTKAGKIEYRALTQYLLSASGFQDDYDALRQSCTDLVGVAGITAGDCTEVTAALDAVEMSDPWPCGNPAVPPLCDVNQVRDDLFYDDFEELAGGNNNDASLLSRWTQRVLVTDSHWDLCCLGPFATSGTGNAWAYDVAASGDSALEMVSDVAVPAGGAFFQVNHSFGFENGGPFLWDGGVVEYSTDGGAGWSDAGALISGGASYVGTVTSMTNPLDGRQAFGGDSFGYTATQLDLSSLAGSDVRLRFRIGTDSIGSDLGWFIDDARIYTCTDCTPDLVITAGTVTGTETRLGCNSITAGTTFGVAATGDLTLRAPSVALTSGFSVASGGKLTVRTR